MHKYGYNANDILVWCEDQSIFHSADAQLIHEGESVAVLGCPNVLHQLIHDSQ